MAGHFEAKKIAWRQTKDGLVLALAVHPDDMPKEMALSALNTRYMIAFSEIGDDEKPVQKPTALQASEAGGSSTSPTSRKWEDLPLSTQAGIRCGEADFRAFLKLNYSEQFDGEEPTAQNLRRVLGVETRGALDRDDKLARDWKGIETEYQTYRTDRQYAGAKR